MREQYGMNDVNEDDKSEMREKSGFFAGLITGAAAIAAVFIAVSFLLPLLSDEWGGRSSTNLRTLSIERKANEILYVLETRHIYEIDRQALIEDMFRGLAFGVGDPYTVYMTMDEFRLYIEGTDGAFSGIGVVVVVDREDNLIEIIAPYEGSPGQKAGLMPRDKIIAVNGYSVNGDNLQQAISMIRGVPGTSVTLTILRGSDTFDVTVVRDDIEVPTVSHEMLEDSVGYIRINQFAQVTNEQFFEALTDLQGRGMRGLILDLRNNPGGRLDTVLSITNALIPEGVIMSIQTRTGEPEYHYATAEYLGLPLVVLVNGNSASASEVLAGAVKDTGVGQLVGTTTFGKGIVQNIITLSCGTGALKLTVSRYYTPAGISIQDIGIEPHFEVAMDDVSIASVDRAEDVQLQKAIEVMGGKMR